MLQHSWVHTVAAIWYPFSSASFSILVPCAFMNSLYVVVWPRDGLSCGYSLVRWILHPEDQASIGLTLSSPITSFNSLMTLGNDFISRSLNYFNGRMNMSLSLLIELSQGLNKIELTPSVREITSSPGVLAFCRWEAIARWNGLSCV